MATTTSPTTGAGGPQQARGGSGPALFVAVAVLLAAVYSFWHRSPPPFPATRVHADRLMVNGLAHREGRLVGVGELGRILYADDASGPWEEAKVEPQRGSTLNQVLFVDDKTALAVGHDSWIVRSEDRGQTWREIQFDGERSEPLLGIAGPFDGKLYAFGAFGQFLVSTDLGRSWTRQPLVEDVDPAKAAALKKAAEEDPYGAGLQGGGGIAERHLNAMTRAADGSLWLVGERGLLARSVDGGQTWKAQPEIYAGSFFGILALPSGQMLVHGMRGNAFVSRDDGKTWTRSKIPEQVSLFGAAATSGGKLILAGASNAVLVSEDGGTTFKRVSAEDRLGLTAVLPLKNGSWLTAGEGGIREQQPATQVPTQEDLK
ncbi:MAG TPA: hypothetical protein VFV11_04640 [Solimonas sp.]|nr:hypothetical protein [Solimonas sp.]